MRGLQDFEWKKTLIWFVACFVLTGTLFFIAPGGIGGAVASLPAYFGGWGRASTVSLQRVFVALLAYECLGLIFGVWGMASIGKHGNDVDRFLRNWGLLALLLVVAYPARQEIDLAWVDDPVVGACGTVGRDSAGLGAGTALDRVPFWQRESLFCLS